MKFANGLTGSILSNTGLSIRVGDTIKFQMTKKFGKYKKDYNTGESYFPVYNSIELVEEKIKHPKKKIRRECLSGVYQ